MPVPSGTHGLAPLGSETRPYQRSPRCSTVPKSPLVDAEISFIFRAKHRRHARRRPPGSGPRLLIDFDNVAMIQRAQQHRGPRHDPKHEADEPMTTKLPKAKRRKKAAGANKRASALTSGSPRAAPNRPPRKQRVQAARAVASKNIGGHRPGAQPTGPSHEGIIREAADALARLEALTAKFSEVERFGRYAGLEGNATVGRVLLLAPIFQMIETARSQGDDTWLKAASAGARTSLRAAHANAPLGTQPYIVTHGPDAARYLQGHVERLLENVDLTVLAKAPAGRAKAREIVVHLLSALHGDIENVGPIASALTMPPPHDIVALQRQKQGQADAVSPETEATVAAATEAVFAALNRDRSTENRPRGGRRLSREQAMVRAVLRILEHPTWKSVFDGVKKAEAAQ